MRLEEGLALLCYFLAVFVVGIFSYKKNFSSADFIIGNRSMNAWLTALSAHASDMSSWLFMGYPALILTGGIFGIWTAIGLLVFMFLNWQIVAPRIRVATEQYGSLTFSSFFENSVVDTSGKIRLFTAILSLFFYTVYVSAMLVGLGLLLTTLFAIPYTWGIWIGTLIVIPYVFVGGYLTLAWIDLFQGLFLMGVIVFVPLYLWGSVGGWEGIFSAARSQKIGMTLFSTLSAQSVWSIVGLAMGWGLGYFGQPHIVTKFMGIRNVHEIRASKWIGMSWMTLSLGAATLVGLVGMAFFSHGLQNPELVFVEMVKRTFSPFLIGLILCAVLAATLNAMGSQILILSSSLTEDVYKRFFRKMASPKERLIVARASVLLVSLIALFIAYNQISSIYSLVLYAWSGLGASFGPLLLFCLYWKGVNKEGAWAGILSGGIISALWPYFNERFSLNTPALIPGFVGSALCILLVSWITRPKVSA